MECTIRQSRTGKWFIRMGASLYAVNRLRTPVSFVYEVKKMGVIVFWKSSLLEVINAIEKMGEGDSQHV